MIVYIIRRLIQSAVILFLITVIVFLVMHLLPGDPISLYTPEILTPERRAELIKEYGLDQPLVIQYTGWMSHVLRGDLGRSSLQDCPVNELIARTLRKTIHVGSLALVLSIILGIPAGIVAARRRGKWQDTVATLFANIGICIPGFWLGVMMIYLFAFYLRVLPSHGYTSPLVDFGLSTKQLIMPVICLALFPIATLARQTRSSMLEVLRQDYIRTAWSKGLSERQVIIRHAVKNGLIPIITVIGLQVPRILSGAVVIETVFSIPGFGRLLTISALGKDYQTIQAGVLVAAAIVVLSNLVVDLCYGWLDPRIQYT
jgi:peptide/nickel transport system permease protein